MIGPIQIGAGLAVIGIFVWAYFRAKIRADRTRYALEERMLKEMISRERGQIKDRQVLLGTYDFDRRDISRVLVPNSSIDLSVIDLEY